MSSAVSLLPPFSVPVGCFRAVLSTRSRKMMVWRRIQVPHGVRCATCELFRTHTYMPDGSSRTTWRFHPRSADQNGALRTFARSPDRAVLCSQWLSSRIQGKRAWYSRVSDGNCWSSRVDRTSTVPCRWQKTPAAHFDWVTTDGKSIVYHSVAGTCRFFTQRARCGRFQSLLQIDCSALRTQARQKISRRIRSSVSTRKRTCVLYNCA